MSANDAANICAALAALGLAWLFGYLYGARHRPRAWESTTDAPEGGWPEDKNVSFGMWIKPRKGTR